MKIKQKIYIKGKQYLAQVKNDYDTYWMLKFIKINILKQFQKYIEILLKSEE